MLKNYKDFLLELDLSLGDMGGGDKKEPPPDPEKEIAAEKEKKRKKAEKVRAAQLDKAEAAIRKAIEKTDTAFKNKFEKRIMDALDDDDRVIYHDLILDIQRYQIPLSKDQDEEEIYDISPIVSELQKLNANEYRG